MKKAEISKDMLHAYKDTDTEKIDYVPIEIGKGKIIFTDWNYIEAGYGVPFTGLENQQKLNFMPAMTPYGVKLSVNKAELMHEPLIVADMPHENNKLGGYTTLMYEEGKYRLWYECFIPRSGGDTDSVICYAESQDGKTWVKPIIGNFEYEGSKDNNIVFGYDSIGGHGATIFKDVSALPEERYKLVHVGDAPEKDLSGKKSTCWMYGAVSPDGYKWTRIDGKVMDHTSDTQTVTFYDAEAEHYVSYLRGWYPQVRGGFGGRRIVVRSTTKNFKNFGPPEKVLMPQADDGPDMDIYTIGYNKWPGTKNTHIMLPAMYHRTSDLVDIHLAVSRDNLPYYRPSKEPVVPLREYGGNFYGSLYAGVGIVPYGEGKWAFPVATVRKSHNDRRYKDGNLGNALTFALIREDGFMSLDAESIGEFWTLPIKVEGDTLELNASAPHCGSIFVEITDSDGKPIEGYTMEECDVIRDECMWDSVKWNGSESIKVLQGKAVRFHFKLIRSRIFAFKFC